MEENQNGPYGVQKIRKFEFVERVSNIENKKLPERSTAKSAGYDFYNPEKIKITPYKIGDNPTLVPTGIKAYMQDDEYLMLCNRSSNPKKKGLVLANGVGIVDKDFYGNPDNDGAFAFAFINIKDTDCVIKKGDAIGQAIFQKYYVTDDDKADGKRLGGFGSTNKN